MPISDCEVRDPRIRRTRQMLQAALRTLLETRSFDEISVQEITDEATISRATFYDHYTDKYQLLAALIAGGFHAMLHQRAVRYEGPGTEAPLIHAVCDFLSEIHAAHKCESGPFDPLKDAAITGAIQKVLQAGMPVRNDMAAAAASSAIYSAAREWLNTPSHPPAGEIVPIMQAMIRPILETPPFSQAAALEPALRTQ
jgi:AcrR family transcriptional regulator